MINIQTVHINFKELKIKNHKILDTFDYTFQKGKIYGLVGANGVGKTSFMKKIMFQELKQQGLQVSGTLDKPSLVVDKSYIYNKELYSLIDNSVDISSLEKELNFTDKAKKISTLSLGNRQKANLLCTLLRQADIYLLDEPFNGLDYLSVENIKQYLIQLKKSGKIIILSSHLIDTLKELSDTIILIENGEIKEIKPDNSNYKIKTISNESDLETLIQSTKYKGLFKIKGPSIYDVDEKNLQEFLSFLISNNIKINGISVQGWGINK